MENQEKEQLINNLYALRAGLSVISQEKEKIASAMKKAITQWAAASDEFIAGREMYFFNEAIEIKYFSFFDAESDQHKMQWCEDWATKMDADFIIERIGSISSYNKNLYKATIKNETPNCRVGDRYCIEPDPSWEYQDRGFSILYDCGTFIALPQMEKCKKEINKICPKGVSQETKNRAIYYQWLQTDECKRYLQAKADYFEKYTEPKKYFSKKKEQARQLRERVRIEALNAINAIIEELPKLKEPSLAIRNTMTTALATVKETSKSLVDGVETVFSSVLDLRDWKYLDLVIFYLETGRADTLKEALQLVEREIQTQRIIGAIQEASDRICRTIARAAAVISSQLNALSSQLSTVIAQQQVQIGQNQRLLQAADLQNALLKKANVTSEQLMNDVSYIRQYGTKSIGR